MQARIAVCVWLAVAAVGAAPPVDRQKLRQIVRLPGISLNVGLGFSPAHGFVMPAGDGPNPAAEIAALRKQVTGDARDAERDYRLGELYKEAGEYARAREAFSRSVNLYRRRVKGREADGRLLAQLGAACAVAVVRPDQSMMLLRAARACLE
jgi:hypothetical protein